MSTIQVLRDYIAIQRRLKRQGPLLVALQGPQGSGKTHFSAQVQKELATGAAPLRVVVLSLDDVYLPHKDLVYLAQSCSNNKLLQGRGQPGTHDIQLGIQLLTALRDGHSPVRLPRFDKSLFDGEGDRLPDEEGPMIRQPPAVDVVIFEGWCVGFRSLSASEIEAKWQVWEEEMSKLQIQENLCTQANVVEINELLRPYDALWELFDITIRLGLPPPISKDTSPYEIIYQWRLEQEHYMKSVNGGQGMSDEAVKAFVDRYIPGYVFFSRDGTGSEGDSISPRLVVTLDNSREVLGMAHVPCLAPAYPPRYLPNP